MRSEIVLPSNSSVISNNEHANSLHVLQNQQQQLYQDKKIPIIYKFLLTLGLVTGFTIYRIFYTAFDNSVCIVDKYFDATFEANRGLLIGNTGNIVIGIAQVAIDGWIIFIGLAWLILIQNMRFPVTAGIVYLFRSFFLIIQKLPFDDYIVWHSPSFFSFTVPYDRTRDFFYSGHTSILIIITLELFLIKWYYASLLAFFTLVYMMNVLIITRIHYTIDIIGGIIFTVLIYRLTMNILKYADFLFSVPFYFIRIIYLKIRKQKAKKSEQVYFLPDNQQIMRINQDI